LDEFQRQQLEMAQTGSMYGGPGPQFTGFNPMMANPMMMGMNPMNPMMQSGWGFPQMNPMMSGFGSHSQQMLAAQQAALQAYQQTMMAYSQAGSQSGDMGGMQNMPGMQPMNPMMTGGSMFDPRMSMMGMPMMGMNNGMGQMGPMPPLGMQMTGVSGFDPRFSASPSQFDFGTQQRVNSSSPGHSPAPQGSPAGPRPIDVADQPFRSSANASPHPQTKT
jgi:CCR4-NOT transcriptional complex subunit CAF120